MVAGLSASSRCVKYLMFIFNLLFVITGILLISFGSVILGVYHEYEHFLDNKFFSVPSLLIAIGAIIFVIAFFGCCGAVRENYCMILTFTTLMVIIFILELAGGISGYVLRSHAEQIVTDKMNSSMLKYNQSTEIATFWDEFQREFHCCGTHNSSDWLQVYPNGSIPMSCCGLQDGVVDTVTCRPDSSKFYSQGCLPEFLRFIKAHAVQLGGVALGVAFVQLLGIWFSIFLAKSIKNSYETV